MELYDMSFLENVMSELNQSGAGSQLGDVDLGGIAKTLLSGSGNSKVDTIVSVLKENGLEDRVSSWVGDGANASIDPDEIHSALGTDTVSQLSSELGISSSKLGPILAALLPVIVNQLTPEGKQDGSLLNTGMKVLQGFL